MRHILKQLVHLFCRLKIHALGITHALGIVQCLARLNSDQSRMRFVVFRARKMRIIGRHQGHAHLFVQFDQSRIDLFFFVNTVPLNLQIIIIAKNIEIRFHGLLCRLISLALDQIGDLASHTRRQTNQPFRMLAQQVFIYARIIIKALEIPRRHQLDQIFIARIIFDQQNQMV